MSEELKKIFIKQMLLPKEELVMQTMELMADKMNLQKQLEDIRNYIKHSDLDKMLWGKELMKILDREE